MYINKELILKLMRHIQGYVCVIAPTDMTGIELLFGRNTESSSPPYRNFETNGLTSYATKREAERGKKALEERPTIPEARIARIAMSVVEREEDLEQLTGRAFVAIQLSKEFPKDALLFGRRVEGRPGFDTRAQLRENGLKPYRKRADAEYAASEIRRQAWTPATVASFRLTYVRG